MTSAEVLPSKAIKVMDGQHVLCITANDAGRLAYRPEQLSVSREGDDLELSFVLRGLKCVFKPRQGFVWESRKLNSSYETTARNGQTITNDILNSEAILVNRDFGLADRKLLQNAEVQRVSLKFKLSRVLSSDEVRRRRNGEDVTLSLQYFNLVTSQYHFGGAVYPGGARAWGSYFFEIKL